MSAVRSVAHTGITVRDLPASIAFWTQAVGGVEERRFALSGDFAAGVTGVPGAAIEAAVVGLPGGHRVELLQYTSPAGGDLSGRPCDVGAWHLALETDDLDALVERCVRYGWVAAGPAPTMAEGPRAGTRFVYLRDEDGATLELIEEPSGD